MCHGAAIQAGLGALWYAGADPYGGTGSLAFGTPQSERRRLAVAGPLDDHRGRLAELLHILWLVARPAGPHVLAAQRAGLPELTERGRAGRAPASSPGAPPPGSSAWPRSASCCPARRPPRSPGPPSCGSCGLEPGSDRRTWAGTRRSRWPPGTRRARGPGRSWPRAASLDQTGTTASGEPFTLRWLLVDMIAEYARHNGHADLLRRGDRRGDRNVAGHISYSGGYWASSGAITPVARTSRSRAAVASKSPGGGGPGRVRGAFRSR